MHVCTSVLAAAIGCLISCAREAISSPDGVNPARADKIRLRLAQPLIFFCGALPLANPVHPNGGCCE